MVSFSPLSDADAQEANSSMLPKEKQNRHTNGIISRLGSLGAKSVARTVPQDNVASGVGAKCAYQNIIHTKERIHQYNLI
jgi:hypothetical protein